MTFSSFEEVHLFAEKANETFMRIVNVVFIKLYWQRFPASLIPTKRIISIFVFIVSFGCFASD